jgi:sRNA-binding protein
MVTLTLGWRPAADEKGATASGPKAVASAVATRTGTDTEARRRRQNAVHLVISAWMHRWPDALRLPPVPLAIGTHDAILAAQPELDPAQVHRALRMWTSARSYQRALAAAAAVRVGLDGEGVEPVSPEHQATAWAQFKAMRGKPRRR